MHRPRRSRLARPHTIADKAFSRFPFIVCLSPRGKVGFDVNVGGLHRGLRVFGRVYYSRTHTRSPRLPHTSRYSSIHTDEPPCVCVRGRETQHTRLTVRVRAHSFDATWHGSFSGRQKVISTNEIRLHHPSPLNPEGRRGRVASRGSITKLSMRDSRF